jgi:hypothetical protein
MRMFRMKNVAGAVTLATMVATSAFAADAGALAPGKPAGVKKAQLSDGTLIIGAGAVAVFAAVAIVVSNQSGDRNGQTSFPPATTTSTS